jgi:murein DD-endopeptidase MepM/ murein hydrolase activator NlpD
VGAIAAAGQSLVTLKPTVDRDVTPLAQGAVITSAPMEPVGGPQQIEQFSGANADAATAGGDMGDLLDVRSLTKALEMGAELASGTPALDGSSVALFDGMRYVRPCSGILTSSYGARWGTTHRGVDIANRLGTPIYAVTDGKVIESGATPGYGMWVRILHAGGWTSVYGHVNRALVREGQIIRAGEKIAEMGSRGNSTGPHLHLEIWDLNGDKVNPTQWLARRGIRL